MNTYKITMKNGKEHEVKVEESQNPVGLWVWSMKEHYHRVLNFGELSVLSTEIQSIELIEGINSYNSNHSRTTNNSTYDFNAPLPPPPPPLSFPERQF